MSDLSSITTVSELVAFLSEFIETVPTQSYVDSKLSGKISSETFNMVLKTLIRRNEFAQAMSMKANCADVIMHMAWKATQEDISIGITRKVNKAPFYNLEARVNKLFPFKTVENISERNNLVGDDLKKVILVIDASADATQSLNAKGAIYMFSAGRNQWVKESELAYNAEGINYNNILGKPTASAADIDTVCELVIQKISIVRKLNDIYEAMHNHGSSLLAIDQAVTASHTHQTLTEVTSVEDNDLITVIRNGTLCNVKASVLKEYIGG